MILLDFPFFLEGAEKTGLKPLSSEDTKYSELAEYKNIKQNYSSQLGCAAHFFLSGP